MVDLWTRVSGCQQRWCLIKFSYETPGNRGITEHKEPNEIHLSVQVAHTTYLLPIPINSLSVQPFSLSLFLLGFIGRMVTIEISIQQLRYIGDFSKSERTDVRFVCESRTSCSLSLSLVHHVEYGSSTVTCAQGFKTFFTATTKSCRRKRRQEEAKKV